jgi:uncharacterized membrane protein SirB2
MLKKFVMGSFLIAVPLLTLLSTTGMYLWKGQGKGSFVEDILTFYFINSLVFLFAYGVVYGIEVKSEKKHNITTRIVQAFLGSLLFYIGIFFLATSKH